MVKLEQTAELKLEQSEPIGLGEALVDRAHAFPVSTSPESQAPVGRVAGALVDLRRGSLVCPLSGRGQFELYSSASESRFAVANIGAFMIHKYVGIIAVALTAYFCGEDLFRRDLVPWPDSKGARNILI